MNRLKDRPLAEEVFQLTMIRIHETRHKYDPEFALGPWIFTITKNTMTDELRRLKRRNEVNIDEVGELSDKQTPLKEEKSVPLTGLGMNQKRALEMRYLEEESFAKIAKVLGTSEPNARKLVSRALKKLKLRLGGGSS